MRLRRALLGSALLAAACSGSEARRPPAGPADPSAAAKTALPYESPARWEVHPTPLSFVTATMRLADGSCLVTEHNGQRWLTWPTRGTPAAAPDERPISDGDPDAEPPPVEDPYVPGACSGEGRAALDRAPEPIVAGVRGSQSYGFVGQSGTIHEARSPLGRFTRRVPPPEPLLRVRGAGRTLLAVTKAGRVLRWDEERGFERVDIEGAIAFDVAVSPTGAAVVLATPEAIFTTEDGGRTFRRGAAPAIGLQRVAYPPRGPFLIEGVEKTLAWDPRDPKVLSVTSDRIGEVGLDVVITAGRSPGASLLLEGRGAIDGDRYWEASAGPAGGWWLWKGKIDGRLGPASADVGGPEDSRVVVAAKGNHVALGIARWDGDGQSLRARRSRDGGATFGGEIELDIGTATLPAMAVAPDGAVLVTGACPRAAIDGDASCSGGPLVLRGDAAPSAPRVSSPGGTTLAPAFSPDGRSAYYLARDEDDPTLSLFVSHDGAASFEERPLRIEGDDEDRTFEESNGTRITVGEDGALGILVEEGGRSPVQAWLVADADGRALRVAEPPIPDPVVGGFGARVLAMARMPSVDDDGGVPIWESLDGGATWREHSGPAVLRGAYRRHGDILCGQAGCLIGEDVTRVGWGGDAPGPLAFERPAPPDPPEGMRTPIVCEPRPGSSWTHVDNVEGGDVLPDESLAARGRAAWMIATYDPKSGAAGVVAATMPPSGDGEAHITAKQVLAPVPKGARWAFVRRPQIEGEAFARVTLPAGAPPLGANGWRGVRIRNLEIAWENLEEGSSVRAVLPDAGAFDHDTIVDLPDGRLLLDLHELSVTPKGIFVQVRRFDRAIHHVDTAGKARVIEFPGWPDQLAELVTPYDPVNVDGAILMTATFGGRMPESPQTLLLARPPPAGSKPDEPWPISAVTLAPPAAYDERIFTHMDWTYEGGRYAVGAQHAVSPMGQATSWMARLLPDGTLAAPSRLPTPHDLSATPRPCTAAEHRDLPRVRARSVQWDRAVFPGTRHPVLVSDGAASPPPSPASDGRSAGARPPAAAPAPIGRVALLSDGVILRGTPASPCVDAYSARGVEGQSVAAIVLGDLRQGWLFRAAAPRKAGSQPAPSPDDEARRPTGVDVRPLTCRFDPSAPVPAAIEEANAPR